ncbi:MAG TPA: hypothetical protein VKU01_05590 [Bryobacteraceae bacterium]|nr:hypothetical protein [Bryobacteraceae bacterium]
MIAKGTTHDNGGRLARYLVKGKDDERAELWELRGFASDEIVEAFRSIHVIAAATKAEQPFFHVQVRNPEGESLTREQWQYTADRIERMLGLSDQPRAIAFHIDEKSGERHMHVAWSRIDEETLTAKALPFYKDRLKKISRELELHFGLTLVPNERDGEIKYAPTRAEDEQARRLGLDAHQVRETIRDCYTRSDSARSFEAALAEEGMVLAAGSRRDYLVIDQAGGMHALGKRLLDVSAAEIRDRFADLPREQLPSVEQARAFLHEQALDRHREQAAPVWDRERDEVAWQKAVVDGAIQKGASQEYKDRQVCLVAEGAEIEDEEVRRKRGSAIGDRWIDGPQTGHMIEHHDWALDQVKANDERRRQEEHSGVSPAREKQRTEEEQEIDMTRFKTDPDYRRSIETRMAESTAEQRQHHPEVQREITHDFGQR